MMSTANCVVFAISGLLMLDGVYSTGRITPLFQINNTACIAENLRITDRYICDSLGKVICLGGWSDPSTLCNVPVCNVNEKGCLHGECIFPNVCACEVGWDGPNCDECIPLGGCRHGSCNKPMECNCKPGWTGGQCKDAICEGCINGCCHEPNQCICDFGWTGQNCTECMTLSNCKNGKCIDHPFQCECLDGWKGIDCNTPICRDNCHPQNGFCESPGECICQNGWTGRECTTCVPYPGCNGTCVDNTPWTCTDENVPGPGKADEWSPWGEWSTCSKSCGDGVQNRERNCPAGSCVGVSVEKRNCNEKNCKIDGNWALWTQWSACSKSCGTGNKIRFRACSTPSPKFGGKECDGESSESSTCFQAFCPIDGRWSAWNPWRPCSVSCGFGLRSRFRDCGSPKPEHGGNGCNGDNSQEGTCSLGECPVDGTWLYWSPWSSCSKTCGEGQQRRGRNCQEPLFGGRPCPGNSTTELDIIPCWERIECPTDGNWSEWEPWTICSVSCGGGSRNRLRKCNNPAPKFGGLLCRGAPSEVEQCNADINCPIDGKWNIWGQWSVCPVTCGEGTQTRERGCVEPEFGGRPCPGVSSQDRRCNDIPCAFGGTWSLWSEWTTCTTTCQTGARSRTRTCNDGSSSSSCFGSSTEEEPCNANIPCQGTGLWSVWSSWSPCSKTCGNGEQMRSRKCPTYDCIGDSMESQTCNNDPCGSGGSTSGWTQWTQWSSCSKTCGVGTTKRSRKCNPLTDPCLGNAKERKSCSEGDCPAQDGNWGEWNEWSTCSVSCGKGLQERVRLCNNPAPTIDGKFCSGINRKSRACKGTGFCPPINGGLSEWGPWSPCTVDCLGDHGDQVRRRHCSNPEPQFNGRPCSGKIKDRRHCTGDIIKQESDPAGKCYHIGA